MGRPKLTWMDGIQSLMAQKGSIEKIGAIGNIRFSEIYLEENGNIVPRYSLLNK